ncbi:dihydropteroate synthase [Jeotgalibacillus sp. ET6]|uniref:dihydropteroate synthase n=1 Tax=Jeotgalibacillus sp. ET6 TaxID=3037260 RepID=UPI003FA5CBB5
MAEEEIARVVPMIRAIVKEVDMPISIDTYSTSCSKSGCDGIYKTWEALLKFFFFLKTS